MPHRYLTWYVRCHGKQKTMKVESWLETGVIHHLYIYLDVKVEVEIEEIEEQWNENYFSVPRDSETLSGLPQTQPQFVRTCGIIDSRWNDSNKKGTRGPPVLQLVPESKGLRRPHHFKYNTGNMSALRRFLVQKWSSLFGPRWVNQISCS